MSNIREFQIHRTISFVALGFVALWMLWGSTLAAQSSDAAASERLRFFEMSLGGGDKKIGEDDLRAFLKAQKNNPALAQPLQESQCDQEEKVDCDTWLETVAIRSFGADRNANEQLDPEELRDFEVTVIWGSLLMRDLLPAGAPLPASTGDTPLKAKDFPDWLGDRVTIRQSFLDERKASDPASISWTHFGGGDETLRAEQRRTRFDIQAALSIELGNELKLGGAWSVTPVFVIESDISTDETIGRDSVIHRLGGQFYGESDIDALVTAHFVDFTFDYRTDRDYRSEVLGATLQYTPNMPKLGVGFNQPMGALFFRWRPYVGLIYSDVRDPGRIASLQQSDGFTNAFGRVRLETVIGARFIAAVEGQVVFELEEENEDHTAFGASLRYMLDREGHVFLQASYDQGEKPPRFESKEQTKIGLGIKF